MAELTRAVVDAEHLVARYLRGAMPEEQLEQFEAFLLLNPDVAREVETDRAMRMGLRGMEPPRRARGPLRLALAAGVAAVAVGVAAFLVLGDRPAPLSLRASLDEIRSGTRSPETFTVAATRGARIIELAVDEDSRAIQLNYLPTSSDDQDFELRLFEVTRDGEVMRGQVQVQVTLVDGMRAVPVFVDLGKARAANLRLEVRSAHSQENFGLRVQPR